MKYEEFKSIMSGLYDINHELRQEVKAFFGTPQPQLTMQRINCRALIQNFGLGIAMT